MEINRLESIGYLVCIFSIVTCIIILFSSPTNCWYYFAFIFLLFSCFTLGALFYKIFWRNKLNKKSKGLGTLFDEATIRKANMYNINNNRFEIHMEDI